MKAVVGGAEIELEPNSKPYLLKRIVADGFDIVLIAGLFLLFTALVMRTSLADTYHAHFDRSQTIKTETAEALAGDREAVSEALGNHAEYLDEVFAANLHSYLLKALAAFAAEALVLLVFPLSNRDRATPGRKMTGILLFNGMRRTRAAWYQIVGRFLFILVLDSLVLYLFTGILTFFLVPALRLTEMLTNKKNRTLCDLMTGTTAIEKLSYQGIN